MPSVTLALIGARLRAARGRPFVVVLALATAGVIPILVSVSAAVTADAALSRGLAGLPSGDRSAIVTYNGFLTGRQTHDTDTLVRRQLAGIVDGQVRSQVQFRRVADSTGQLFVLAGTDDLASAVRLTSGRRPSSCTPSRCEVLALTGAGGRVPVVRSGFGLVIVGEAVRADPRLLAGTTDPGAQVPVLLGDGVDAVAQNQPLALRQRSYGWIAPLDRRLIVRHRVSAWTTAAADVADRLTVARPGLILTTPDQTIQAQATRADASARRFGLLAGSCAVLLLGSALIGGAALRPDEVRFVTALRRRGLSPGRLRLVVAAEALALASVAALAGLLVGTVLAAVLAGRAGLAAWPTALSALRAGAPSVLGLAVGAFVLLTITLWPARGVPDQVAARGAWRAVTGTAIGCLLALLLLISRGTVTAAGVDGSGDPLLIALPALVLLALGLGAARSWPFAIRAGYRVLPRSAVGARLGIAGIAARPLLAASTVGLLAAAVGATGFAASYRSTLQRGAADQAAFQVPLTARITPGSALQPVLAVPSVADYQQVAPGARAVPVLREAGSIRTGSRDAAVIQLIGLPPSTLSGIRRWPSVVSGPAPGTVASAIGGSSSPAVGVALPIGKNLQVKVTGPAQDVQLVAWLQADDGRERSVTLTGGTDGPPNTWTLSATLPAASGIATTPGAAGTGWTLTALTVSQTKDDATRRQHGLGEGDSDRPVPAGRLGLGSIQVDGVALPTPWADWDGDGLAVTGDGATAVLNYRLTGASLVLHAAKPGPGSPDSGIPLPVAADPVTAASGKLLTITLNSATVQARVVATLPRFPTVTGRFVIADDAALRAVSDRTSPGAGQAGEIWLGLPNAGRSEDAAARRTLAAGQFTGLQTRWSADVEQSLRTDPVARGAIQLLGLAAVVTLLVALAALVLLVVGERVEDAAELYTWEANGVRPGVLRLALWVRAALVALVAVPAGVVGSLVLTRLTARLVDVTAGAGTPQPPLVAVTGLGTELPALLIGLAATLAIAGLVAAVSFREPLPVLDPAAVAAARRWRR